MLSVKKSSVFDPQANTPSVSPLPRFHWPCDHGPITSRLTSPGFCFSAAAYALSAPHWFSVSNQPPTQSIAALRFFRCGLALRAAQNESHCG